MITNSANISDTQAYLVVTRGFVAAKIQYALTSGSRKKGEMRVIDFIFENGNIGRRGWSLQQLREKDIERGNEPVPTLCYSAVLIQATKTPH